MSPWVQVPRGVPGGAQVPALTVVELVVGLLLGAVGRDPVDLHAHEGIHDGAALVPVQLGQLLGCDHLWHRELGTRAQGPRGLRGTWVWGKDRCPQEKGRGWHLAGVGDGAGRREVADVTQWLTPAGFGDGVGVTQEKCHGWHTGAWTG